MPNTALYLAAIILANISAAYLGPWSTPLNAFLLVGLTLSSRDALHDAWHHNRLVGRMAALILAGSILTAAISWKAQRIAIASACAFAVSGTVDTAIYHIARHLPPQRRINLSNLGSAAVDSVIFPALAFGAIMPAVSTGQFIAKVAGGALWARILALHSTASGPRP
ncbi:MAG: VUT family protein [Anaerolineae bacterium]